MKSITLTDLNNVLDGLTMTPLFKNNIENMNGFVVGGVYCCVLVRGYNLYLGAIEDIHPNNIIVVSYLIRADTKGKT